MKKIIIPNDNGLVSQHFGHAQSFALFEIHDNKILQQTSVASPGHEPGMLPKFFYNMGVNLVITGGMGGRAIELFRGFNIDVIVGISGRVEDVIKSYLEGNLPHGKSTCHEQREDSN